MKPLWLCFVLLFTAMPAWAQVQTGAPAPDFTLPDTSGHDHSLSANRGRFIVLEWTNPDCPFVKKHYASGNIPGLQTKYTAQGVVWWSIDSSAKGKEGYYEPAELQSKMKGMGNDASAVLLDPSGAVGRLYGAQTTPHMFVIDTDGIVVYQGAIDSVPSADKADIAHAENYVTRALGETMTGQPVSMPATKSYGCSVKY